MIKQVKEQFRLEVRPLTALSINSGTSLDYASYVIGEEGSIAVVDVAKLIGRILKSGSDAARHELNNVLDRMSNDLTCLKDMVTRHYCEDDVLYRSSVNAYTKTRMLNAGGNQNINEIYRCLIDGKSVPVIPGSSIKGALRTAFSGQASKEAQVIDDDTYNEILKTIKAFPAGDENKKAREDMAKTLEAEIDARIMYHDGFFTSPDEPDLKKKGLPNYSAMRNLLVSDCMPVSFETSVSYMTMPGRQMGKALPLMDVIRGSLLGSRSVFSGTLSLGDIDLPHKLNLENLVKDCNDFSSLMFKKEAEVLIDILREREKKLSFDLYDELAGIIGSPRKENEFIIRMGRFSQREYVTYSNDMRYVDKETNPYDRKWGSTRTMMTDGKNLIPLGWCICTLTRV